MSTITDITSQVKNFDRANLFVDGQFRCGIAKMVIAKYRLKIGQEICDEEIENYLFESDKEKAFSYALNYVNRYSPTQKQLANKLYEKEYNRQVVDYVIEKCKEYNYINDLEYARCYTSYNKDFKGKIKIKNDLRLKGITSDIIDSVLNDLEENDGAYELALKHSKRDDIFDIKYQAKLSRYLAGRGYAWSEIMDVISRLKDNANEEES